MSNIAEAQSIAVFQSRCNQPCLRIGSIGTQTLDIIREHNDRFELVALAAGGNVKLLAEQVSCLSPD